MQNSAMWQLRFSVRKVLKLAVGSTLLSFGALIIPFNQKIATGHMPGFWNGLLYDIGPTGRWIFALACMGFFLSAVLGLSMVLVGDRVALRSTERGIFVRTIGMRRDLPWSEVLLIDASSTTYRRRTRRSVRIRIRAGDGEKSLLLPMSLLDADEDEIAGWIAVTRRLHASSETSKSISISTDSRLGFGRKRAKIS